MHPFKRSNVQPGMLFRLANNINCPQYLALRDSQVWTMASPPSNDPLLCWQASMTDGTISTLPAEMIVYVN